MNNCTPVGKNNSDDTLTNETILTDTKGVHTFQNTHIGVDTVAPYYKFHLRFDNTDTALSGGSSGAWGSQGIRIENTNNTAGTMSLAHFRNFDADWHIGSKYVTTNNSDFIFTTEGNERLRIDSAGRVTVKNSGSNVASEFQSAANHFVITNNGACGLTIDATSSTNCSIHFADGATGDESYRGFLVYNHSGDSLRIGTAGAEKLRITSEGNLCTGSGATFADGNETNLGLHQTFAGREVAGSSGTWQKIFRSGHTFNGTVRLYVTSGASLNGGGVMKEFAVMVVYGAPTVTEVRSKTYGTTSGNLSSVELRYNNSGYQIEARVSWSSGNTPYFSWTSEGHATSIWSY
jgi:hypothetical protein